MQPFPENNNVVPGEKIQSNLLSRKEAASYLGLREKTLAQWTLTKRYDLPVVKIGRLVKYKKSDLDKFIETRTIGMASNL